MSRSDARDCGLKLVFEYLFNKDFDLEMFFEDNNLIGEEKDFALSIFNNVKIHFEEINSKITSNLKNNMKLTDLYTLDHAILMTAIAQIDYLKDSIGLVINESVRLSKKYSTEKSPSFINGVLGSIYKEKN